MHRRTHTRALSSAQCNYCSNESQLVLFFVVSFVSFTLLVRTLDIVGLSGPRLDWVGLRYIFSRESRSIRVVCARARACCNFITVH